MSERSQELFLSDILESIDAIKSFVTGCDFDLFCGDRKTFSATIRLTQSRKERHTHMTENKVAGFRKKTRGGACNAYR